ncbi:hypothetical protein K7X08_007231 [Anisodus acutangulus]|uniref:Uncharacterized protein n=1 Tax=Anisodus acutangulus TaxID=402998 RepID=A0A9Q1LDQ0_9SOLA|nr:hypothetical protein K7X08_007231 [Anisodus acutangulus]
MRLLQYHFPHLALPKTAKSISHEISHADFDDDEEVASLIIPTEDAAIAEFFHFLFNQRSLPLVPDDFGDLALFWPLMDLASWDYYVLCELGEDQKLFDWISCYCGRTEKNMSSCDHKLISPDSSPCRNIMFQRPRTTYCYLLAHQPEMNVWDPGIHSEFMVVTSSIDNVKAPLLSDAISKRWSCLFMKLFKTSFLDRPKECYLAQDAAFREQVIVGSLHSPWAICFFYGTWFGVLSLLAVGRNFRNSSSTDKTNHEGR